MVKLSQIQIVEDFKTLYFWQIPVIFSERSYILEA